MNHVIWVEKYRPSKIEDCILSDSIKNILRGFLDTKVIPNLLLYGSPGSGKTTTAKALVEELNYDYIIINGSLGAEESGIDAIRNRLRNFASTVSLNDNRKAIIIDEADYLNINSSQPALRAMIEEYADNCSFIFTCNYKERIIEPIRSRCCSIDFSLSKNDKLILAKQFVKRLLDILKEENVQCTNTKIIIEFVMKYFNRSNPDLRKCINELQKFSSVNGIIDEGILSNKLSVDIDFKSLSLALKEKDYSLVRKWVVSNSLEDPIGTYRKIYDNIEQYVTPQSLPPIIVLLGDYLYKAISSSMDQEINMLAFLTELMAEPSIEFK